MSIFGTSQGMRRGTRPMYGGPSQIPPQLSNTATPFTLHNKAIEQQAGDYGNIMKGYQNLLNQGPSAASSSAVANLGDLATTGGISDADAANIRARGVSPIRAAYATAQRNTDRQRGLQGGYSPNYGAVQAKLAREQSEQMAQGNTNVEAALAELKQKGRLSSAGQYASASQNQDSNQRDALQGMTSLYGTTPALANLYGNQAMQGAQFQNTVNQQNKSGNLDMIGKLISGLR